ncbi:MAG: DegV family protein, partial [Niameybacter sp.]
DKFTTSRGFKKAIQKICADMLEDGVSSAYQLYITHAMREDLALEAKSVILDYIPNANIEIKLLGPAFTTQGGPGCVAIQWIKKHDLLA